MSYYFYFFTSVSFYSAFFLKSIYKRPNFIYIYFLLALKISFSLLRSSAYFSNATVLSYTSFKDFSNSSEIFFRLCVSNSTDDFSVDCTLAMVSLISSMDRWRCYVYVAFASVYFWTIQYKLIIYCCDVNTADLARLLITSLSSFTVTKS